ncbi:MAG: hypothetical protein JNK00_00420 [Flavipsychrobacter sp.]|nr:hypothetical protein [Flavipsychrobacter sp.]
MSLTEKYNKGLFADWVPKIVQLLLILVFIILLFPMSSIYVGNLSYMVGETGQMAEYFMWANFAGTVGMGAAMPVAFRVKLAFKIKDKVIFILLLVALFNFIIATTENPIVIVLVSILMNFFKMMALIEFMLPVMMILNPDGNRGKFYAMFYPFILGISQVGGYLLTKEASYQGWEYIYFQSGLICVVLTVVALIFMHNKHFDKPVPLYYIDWLSGILFILCFTALAYVLSFGKQQDWFNSSKIIFAGIFTITTFVILYYRQKILKYPFLSFNIFKRNNVKHGMVMLLMLGMFMALSSVQSIYTTGILNYDPIHNGKLNMMMLPGFVIAGIFAYNWFKAKKPIKYYIFSGFSSMMLYCLLMYFYMVPELNYERWYLPMFFKGFGMCSLFISAWFYTLDNLQIGEMLAAIGIVMVWRTFVTIGIFSAIFSWLQYQFQIESLGNLAIYYDGVTLPQQLVTSNIKSIQLNAVLAANKRLIGYVLIAGLGVLLYIVTHHFGKDRYFLIRLNELADSAKREYRAEKKSIT